MNDQIETFTENVDVFQVEAGNTSNEMAAVNPIIERALRRLKESQSNDNHVSHYTKHSSYSTKHSSSW